MGRNVVFRDGNIVKQNPLLKRNSAMEMLKALPPEND